MQDRTSTLHSLIGADGEDQQPPLIAPDEGCDGSDDTLRTIAAAAACSVRMRE